MFGIFAFIMGIFASYGLWLLLLNVLPHAISMIVVIAIFAGWAYAIWKGNQR